jgi:lysozyme
MINQDGVNLIKYFEGKPGSHEPLLDAYRCPAGKWTIGWGHTGDVKPGDKITYHQAEAILEHDIDKHGSGVFNLLSRTSCNENQFAALVSFAFNEGVPALAGSHLLAKFKAADVQGAAAEFPKWKYAHDGNGQLIQPPGLLTRRLAEQKLFLAPVTA